MNDRNPQSCRQLEAPWRRLRRFVFVALVLTTGGLGSLLMAQALTGKLDGWLILWKGALFFVTFTWIAVGFWTAVAGFVLRLLRVDPLALRRPSPLSGQRIGPELPAVPTALVMPIFHEDVEPVLDRIEQIWNSLIRTGRQQGFHFFVLSDSQAPSVIRQEEAGIEALRARLPADCQLTYRRRTRNTGRKPGNIADFCWRWGRQYRYMVVLDADSLMTGETLLELVARMEANPRAGLLQTLPLPVRQRTLFGRLQQFAHALHSPMLATGQSFWQTDAGNYWGHNAIIRLAAFMEHCRLPVLRGRPPMGGEILSHDFVEAALLRRAGWEVWLLPDLGGSHEEMPSNLVDYAGRDRRWCQGNLQHLRLVGLPGLHWMSRVHFLFGAMSYLSSPAWLLLLVSSTLIGLGWGSFPAAAGSLAAGGDGMFLPLLLTTVALLFLPRLMGIALASVRDARPFGGRMRLLVGGSIEIVASVLIAPILMFYHSRFVASVLLGRSVPWTAQARDHRPIDWPEAVRHGAPLSALALAWGGLSVYFIPGAWLWMLPVLVGLVLAPLLLRWSGDVSLGDRLRGAGGLDTESLPQGPGSRQDIECRIAGEAPGSAGLGLRNVGPEDTIAASRASA